MGPSESANATSEDGMTYQEQKGAIKDKVAGVVGDMTDRAASVAEKARSEGAAAKREVVNVASDLANRASEALNSVDAETVGKTVSASFNALGQSLRAKVRERPLGALAVAAAIGLVLGAMSKR
jgi:ElaB/YqjD/DUF883 family membrane-anchored ribosome-binding protein